ncbi:MAG TPA: TetR/AcrR family transcriptional regulator [Gemmatimonadaceae bacterium]|nr:TetR/AcrR family transcriptional regulator [Gemmatimonadaceae bacterium]
MTAAKPYHHGDLRKALIDAAIELLREGGVDALTLRAAARRAGVSQAAPYRHFDDHADLLAAVAADGFNRLGRAMMHAAQAPSTSPGGLRAVAHAYVKFGLRHPAEYRVMFASQMSASGKSAELDETSKAVFGGLEQSIRALQQRGLIRPGDATAVAIGLWAAMHGLVMLILDEHASVSTSKRKPTVADVEARVNEVTELLMYGMAPR